MKNLFGIKVYVVIEIRTVEICNENEVFTGIQILYRTNDK